MGPKRTPGRSRPAAPGKPPRIAVIIPAFNHASMTTQCLERLLKRTPGEIVVVDDASTDDTPKLLARHARRIKVMTHQVNCGFARSCNDGAAAATARDYLVFLNNDTIPQPGWLETLIDYADAHPQAAVVGAKLLFANDTIQHAGVVICQDGYTRHIYTGFPAEHPAVSKSRRFQIVTGACMLVRRQVFEEAGGFDTAFRNGFEDVDLCLRLGQRGYEIHYCADSVVYHLESVSPGRFKHDRQNVDRYRKRWMGRVRPDDLDYYLEDGLLRLHYEGRYPIVMEVSPLLATLPEDGRHAEVEGRLREQSREIADWQRENARLRLALGAHEEDSPELRYQQLCARIGETAKSVLPAGSTVLVVSKGDSRLLKMPGLNSWHFPQTKHGAYAGHHPADSAEAIAHLESLRAKGAEYLLIPATYHWWLEHYADFRRYLETQATRLDAPAEVCLIYRLGSQIKKQPSCRAKSARNRDEDC